MNSLLGPCRFVHENDQSPSTPTSTIHASVRSPLAFFSWVMFLIFEEGGCFFFFFSCCTFENMSICRCHCPGMRVIAVLRLARFRFLVGMMGDSM